MSPRHVRATLAAVLITLLAGCATSPAVQTAPPPMPAALAETQPPQPGSGYIWLPGHYEWRAADRSYVWVPGIWAVPPPDYVFVPGHWESRPGGSVWVESQWRKS